MPSSVLICDTEGYVCRKTAVSNTAVAAVTCHSCSGYNENVAFAVHAVKYNFHCADTECMNLVVVCKIRYLVGVLSPVNH